jgi:hypothetical protein
VNAHDRYDELAVGHALDALEPSDEADFLAHLLACSLCQDAVAEHRDTLAHLSYAVPSAEPPASVLEGIRAGVAASGRAGAFPAPVTSLAERRARTVKLRTALVGVAASVVLVVALAVGLVTVSNRNSQLTRQDVAFSRAVSGLLTAGAQRVELTPHSGSGKVVAVVHEGKVDLVMSGVSANDAHRSTYVLWQQAADRISAAGTFDVRSSGLTVVSTGLHVADGALQQLMITREAGRTAPPTARGAVLYSGSA